MFFNGSYPNSETNREIIITSSIVGGLLYFLLIIYQPFGTSQFVHAYKYLLLFPYALITTFSFCSIGFLIKGKIRHWTVGLELLKILLIFFLASLLFYLYNSLFLSKVPLSVENFLYMFLYTAALGFPVAAIYVTARYIYLGKKTQATAPNKVLNPEVAPPSGIVEKKESGPRLHIVADYGNSDLELAADDFVFAEAVDNYCFIYFYKNGIIQKELVRLSLTKLLSQIQSNAIQRVHRSFIVNLKKVTKYKGNASGYKLSVADVPNDIMVSRSYIDSIVPLLKVFVVRP